MKKNFKAMPIVGFAAMAVTAISVLALASCGSGKDYGDTSNYVVDSEDTYSGALTVSGPSKQADWLTKRLTDYNSARTKAGLEKITFTTVIHEEDKVDSEIADWTTGPDVYAYASDKIMPLYQAGALSELHADYSSWINTTMGEDALSAVTFAGKVLSYPYAGDNGYFLYYNSSSLDAADIVSMESLFAKAATLGKKIAYPVSSTSYYSAGALFSYGSRYNINLNDQGQIESIDADFDQESGILAGLAIIKIMASEQWQDTQAAPDGKSVIACVDGSWNSDTYKAAMGSSYACAKLPTITVNYGGTDHTTNLSSFLGYKQLGVNPQVSSGNASRLLAAHNLAQYLASEVVQNNRFTYFSTAPTNKVVLAKTEVQNNPAVKAIGLQSKYAVAQTAVPGNIWTAPNTLTAGIADGTITAANIAEAMLALNDSIESSR